MERWSSFRGPERVGGLAARTDAGMHRPGMEPGPGEGPGAGEDGVRMAAERPGGYAARKLRNRRTRSAMGGWVLKSWPAPPDSGLTV